MSGEMMAARAAMTSQAVGDSATDTPLEVLFSELTGLQDKLTSKPERFTPAVAQQAYILLHAEHFAGLRELLLDLAHRSRPPSYQSMEAEAMALSAYRARCALVDVLYHAAEQHKQSLEPKKETKNA